MPDDAPEELTYSATTTSTRSILPADMISVEEARGRILEQFARLEAVEVALLDAVGQVLAEDIVAGFSIPPLANTAMDGYAVRAEDTAGATYDSPLQLEVIGYLPAGQVYDGSVATGQAVRIMTGAPMPDGSDAVVPFEETDEYGSDEGEPSGTASGGAWDPSRTAVRIDVEARPGANIRVAGEDVREGELVLPEGSVIGPARVGVLASLGRDRVLAYRRPVVAVLSTGDELLRPGEPLTPGKIYDSNAFSLAAQVRSFGGIPMVLDVARDTVEALTARIHEALDDADMLVTSAGVSRGDFDVVKTVLANEGEVGFWTVKMKPGKPLAFGTFRGTDERQIPHLGLPGNPCLRDAHLRAIRSRRHLQDARQGACLAAPGHPRGHHGPHPQLRWSPLLRPRLPRRSGRQDGCPSDRTAGLRRPHLDGPRQRLRDLPRGRRVDRTRR